MISNEDKAQRRDAMRQFARAFGLDPQQVIKFTRHRDGTVEFHTVGHGDHDLDGKSVPYMRGQETWDVVTFGPHSCF